MRQRMKCRSRTMLPMSGTNRYIMTLCVTDVWCKAWTFVLYLLSPWWSQVKNGKEMRPIQTVSLVNLDMHLPLSAGKSEPYVLACHGSAPLRPLNASWPVWHSQNPCDLHGDQGTPGKTPHVLACPDHQTNGTDRDHDTPARTCRVTWDCLTRDICQDTGKFFLWSWQIPLLFHKTRRRKSCSASGN